SSRRRSLENADQESPTSEMSPVSTRYQTFGNSMQVANSARTRPAAVTLVGLVAGSVVLRIVIASAVHGPFFFMDELGYQQMARSLARTGHFALFGKAGLAYSPLYPTLLSPV